MSAEGPRAHYVSNFNVGLLGQQAGLSLNELLTISGTYARVNSFYDPGRPGDPPVIGTQGKDRIEISIPEVSFILLRRQKWRNVFIDYNIGRIDYP